MGGQAMEASSVFTAAPHGLRYGLSAASRSVNSVNVVHLSHP